MLKLHCRILSSHPHSDALVFCGKQDAREAAAFIRPMLEMDPTKRATAQEMLDHPWLEGVGRTGEEVIKIFAVLMRLVEFLCTHWVNFAHVLGTHCIVRLVTMIPWEISSRSPLSKLSNT